jgi:hypothetical protein
MIIRLAASLGALSLLAALPALGQVAVGSGLVVVNIGNVSPEIAKNINVDVSQIPVTVQAPISVAAAVCGVDANVLSQQTKPNSPATCTARNTTTALNQIVQQQLKSQTAAG